jgi:hypothetical protein
MPCPMRQTDDTPIHKELQEIGMYILHSRRPRRAKVKKKDSLGRWIFSPEERRCIVTLHYLGAERKDLRSGLLIIVCL